MVKEREEEEASTSMSLILPLLLFLPLLCSSCCSAQGNLTSDASALIGLKKNLSSNAILDTWNNASEICSSWLHVTCSANPQRVSELRLPGKSLNGSIAPDTIGRLDALQVLSLRSNKLSGGLPPDFANLYALKQLNISFNRFSGPIDSLKDFTQLRLLDLQNNSFSGTIPSLDISNASLQTFTVANNNLSGSIPGTLARFPRSSFTGNVHLCGGPLQACSSVPSPSPPPPPSPSLQASQSKSNKLSKGAIVGITCGATAAALLLLLLLLLCRKRKGEGAAAEPKRESTATAGEEGEERNKLVFIDGKKLFDLDDLLRASAVVLGKGTLGTSYKAVLEDGLIVVTKRLHEVDDGRQDEFWQRINAISNLFPLRAYSFGKGGKVLVYDFMKNGSLSALLHGSRGEGYKPLDWEARMRIAATAARGLAFLHAHDMVHGNLKSANVLLKSNLEACLADYHMLLPLAPEITDPADKITPQADVFSFGVILLELLTGKVPLVSTSSAPNDSLPSASPIDLPHWVQSVAREEWTTQVLDPSLVQSGQPFNEEEMVQLLQVAMTCAASSPDQRPSMVDVVRMIDNIHKSSDLAKDGD